MKWLVAAHIASAQTEFPQCMKKDTLFRGKGEYALMTDVSAYGLAGCFLDNCQNSDKWISASHASCAHACSTTQECSFWSFGLEDGSNKCWLRISDAGSESLSGYFSGEASCVPQEFPECVKNGVNLNGPGHQNAYGDVKSLGKSVGCTNDNCEETDKFASSSQEDCSTVCAQLDQCHWWSFGEENGVNMCWMRASNAGESQGAGFTSAPTGCAPLSAWEPLLPAPPVALRRGTPPGNEACWSGGFNWEVCCSEQFGEGGNVQCWDGHQFSFDNCCFAPEREEL